MRLFSGNLILLGESSRDGCRATGMPDMRSSLKEDYQNLIPKCLLIKPFEEGNYSELYLKIDVVLLNKHAPSVL